MTATKRSAYALDAVTALGAAAVAARLVPDPASPIYAGHYPDLAVIPGALLINIVDCLARRAFPDLLGPHGPHTIHSARFLFPSRPQWIMDVRAELRSDETRHEVRAVFSHDDQQAASIRLHYPTSPC